MESAAKSPAQGSGSPFHATAATALASKGLRAASSNRLTCTADHLPPRAAEMPRLLQARCNGPQ
jgi:hypothetical protein